MHFLLSFLFFSFVLNYFYYFFPTVNLLVVYYFTISLVTIPESTTSIFDLIVYYKLLLVPFPNNASSLHFNSYSSLFALLLFCILFIHILNSRKHYWCGFELLVWSIFIHIHPFKSSSFLYFCVSVWENFPSFWIASFSIYVNTGLPTY